VDGQKRQHSGRKIENKICPIERSRDQVNKLAQLTASTEYQTNGQAGYF
jgi:hypothetical protein